MQIKMESKKEATSWEEWLKDQRAKLAEEHKNPKNGLRPLTFQDYIARRQKAKEQGMIQMASTPKWELTPAPTERSGKTSGR